MEQSLTPKQVAQAIGVSEASLKRWCDQGLLPTLRTAGGHRRLPLNGVIQYLRSTGRELVKPEVLGLPSVTGQGDGLISRAIESLQGALEAGNEEYFRRHVFNLYLSGKSVAEICDKAIAPAFHDIGARWSCGDLDVYQERRACEICKGVLHELRKMLPPLPANAPKALGGTLSGDQYLLPTFIVEIILREAGWNAQSLGSNLPSASFCAAMRNLRPRILWLSVSHIDSVEPFLRQFEMVYETALALNVAVVIGGRALQPDIRTRLRYTAYCDNFAHVISFASSCVLPSPTSPERITTP